MDNFFHLCEIVDSTPVRDEAANCHVQWMEQDSYTNSVDSTNHDYTKKDSTNCSNDDYWDYWATWDAAESGMVHIMTNADTYLEQGEDITSCVSCNTVLVYNDT